MELTDLISPAQVIAGLRVRDKAELLRELSRRSGQSLQTEPQLIEAALTGRERLGSTGLGRGFALPHARLAEVERFFGLFARLARPIDFEAIDERPVDLVFMLLIPGSAGSEHVAALAAISRRLRDQDFAQRLRKAPGAAELYATMTAGAA